MTAFTPKAPQLPPYPANGNWLQRTYWTTVGTLKWVAFTRMKTYQKSNPDLTPSGVAIVNVLLVIIGLVMINTGWMPLVVLGLFPLLLGLLWLVLVQPFIQGEDESPI